MARRGRKRKITRFKIKSEVSNNILALLFLTLAFVLSLSLVGLSSPTLILVSRQVIHLFGYLVWFLIFSLLISGLFFLRWRRLTLYLNHLVGSWSFLFTAAALFHQGEVGRLLWKYLKSEFGNLITFIVFLSGVLVSLMLLFDLSLVEVIDDGLKLMNFLLWPVRGLKRVAQLWWKLWLWKPQLRADQTEKESPLSLTIKEKGAKEKVKKVELKGIKEEEGVELPAWQPPDLSLISLVTKKPADRGDINQNKKIIEETLASFGIKAQVKRVNEGAAVTQYALEIAAGTKVSKIISLQNNLALALAAPQGRIRMQVPIPGESLIGIEVPNRNLELVLTSEVLASQAFQRSNSKLVFALGKGVDGKLEVADLAEMPHLLVAGATGSGKSVFLNNLITSFLYKASPEEVKMILVDPKRVELTLFKDLPYLITPVIKDADKVLASLNWAVEEMRERYKQLSEVGVRNIEEYHKLMGKTEMPYLVIVIDELAQVMLFSPNEVERAVTQLAQMARAVGIHLVLATQRPSVDIITGLIKANIPARISFYVTSGVDSKVILDTPGAEKLLGKGDMLFLPPDQASPQRIQGAYISTAEVRNVTNYIREKYRQFLDYKEEVTTAFLSSKVVASTSDRISDELRQAIEVAISEKEISISLLQRKLRIGYNKAARLVEEMEERGWLEAAEPGKKRRKVLLSSLDQIPS